MNLKEYIKKNGIKACHVAQEIGCSPQHLSLIMSGRSGISLWLAYKIEDYTKGKVNVYSWKSLQNKIENPEEKIALPQESD